MDTRSESVVNRLVAISSSVRALVCVFFMTNGAVVGLLLGGGLGIAVAAERALVFLVFGIIIGGIGGLLLGMQVAPFFTVVFDWMGAVLRELSAGARMGPTHVAESSRTLGQAESEIQTAERIARGQDGDDPDLANLLGRLS